MKHKYNATPVVIDGIKFDSKKEGVRYSNLKLLEKHGRISDLKLQVPFMLTPAIYYYAEFKRFSLEKHNGKGWFCIQRGSKYYADFVYTENGKRVVNDVKGFRTAMYRKKANQMRKLYGIEIFET